MIVILNRNSMVEEWCQYVWNWWRYDYLNLGVRLANECRNDNDGSIIGYAYQFLNTSHHHYHVIVRVTLMTKPQPKDTQGDKGWYENNVQLVQWISSVYKSANDRYMETCLVQWISSEIKLRKIHCTRCNPKLYASAYYIIRTNKGNGNIDEIPDS